MHAPLDLAPPSLDGLKGRTLGDFVVAEKLGQGGFGAVYRAEQSLLGREAVVKVLLRREGNAEGEGVQRFLREAKLASQLDHPYCAHVYAFGAEPDGLLWIAMEYVRGTPLDRLLAEHGPLGLSRFVPLFERICEVVQTAHDQGIVHRDLKAANVLVLSRAGRLLPKLLDFGIARMRTDLARAEPRGEPQPEPAPDPAAPTTLRETLNESVVLPLTRGGSFVGSPHSMAPEQWLDPHSADARTDLYALGVLAYQCLTGKLPFDGPSERAIAREHARKPPPPLPPELPAALSEVLGRAMAKAPEQRFQSAIELAAAVRETAGLAADPAQLPQLPDSLREALIAQAPQPLAEAVTALEAATSAGAALTAAGVVRRVLWRLLGALALASRARVGPGADGDPEGALPLLAKLADGTLDARGWAELAREWARPFAERREAHPLPELVSYFFEEDGAQENPRTAALFEPLPAHLPVHDDAAARRALQAQLLSLTQLLTSASFLSSYAWVVGRPQGLERWMGVRRTPRTLVFEQASAAKVGEVALLAAGGGADARPVLSLHPFVQVLQPTPGAPEELFLVEGKGRYGAKRISEPFGFERQDEPLWKELVALLPALAAGAGAATGEPAAPYRGLVAFTAEDRDNFFGREGEAEAFANRLRVQSLLAVVGPSGAGKSSFVQAGVLPALPAGWRSIVLRPGPSPLLTLEARLVAEGLPAKGLSEQLRADPGALAALLRQGAPEGGVWVLVVDQFEELLTLGAPTEERRLYAQAVALAAAGADAPVRVVLTLRDDFLIRVQQLPGLKDRLAQGLQLLGTPAPEDLRRILVEPARRAGFQFEDDALPGEMVRTVAEQPGALALLSFTASTLWELRDRQLRLLSRRAYHGVGGVGGALAHHAEQTLAALAPEEQKRVRECFRHLVTAEGTRAVLTRRELEQLLGQGPLAERVLERLIGARLLVASEGVGGEDRIEVIHEALLGSWPRLVRWQHEDAASARLRDQLRAAARQWEDRGEASGLLWRGDALAEYRLWRSRYGGALTEAEEAFARASAREEARGRRLRRQLIGSAFVVLASALVVVGWFARESRNRMLRLFEGQGRNYVLQHDYLRALVYLSEAYDARENEDALRYLVAKAASGLRGMEATLAGHEAPIIGAAYSPTGDRIVTVGAEKVPRLWDARGVLVAPLTGHAEPLIAASFSPDGKQLLTASRDGTVRFWDAKDGTCTRVLEAHSGFAAWAEFSPDGRRVLTAGSDHTAKLWELPEAKAPKVFTQHSDHVYAARWRPDGRQFVTASNDGTARVYDAATGEQLHVLRHEAGIYWVTYSPDGHRIATASEDRTAGLWDADTGERLGALTHGSPVMFVAFSPDSKRVATASHDREPRVWDANTGRLLLTLVGHVSGARFVTFTPDGARLLTGGSDTAAIVWDARTGLPLCRLIGHLDTVYRVAPSPDGQHLVTASFEGQAKLWNLGSCDAPAELAARAGSPDGRFVGSDRLLIPSADSAELQVLNADTGAVLQRVALPGAKPLFASPSPDGRWAAVGDGPRLQLVPLEGGVPRTLEGPSGAVLFASFSPDGALVASAGEDFRVRVWRVADGRLLATLEGHTQPVLSVAFSPDGRLLASGSADGTARIWDVSAGSGIQTLSGHRTHVSSVRFAPEGERLVTAGWDKSVRVWDVRSGQVLASLEGHSSEVISASFTPDGRYVVTGSYDATARLWSASTGAQLDVFPADSPLNSVEVSPDGRRLLVTTVAEPPRVWVLPPPPPTPQKLRRLVDCFVPLKLEREQLVKRTEPPVCSP